MFKSELEQEQPVVFQTIQHALCNDKVAHAYLFSGPSGTPKKQAAYLLAKSLICEHPEHGFACETCSECERIEHDNFSDMIVLDGSSVSIKKDSIIKLQHEFNKTGLERTGKKFYILDHAENATPDALNSLLKFLEEPSSDMIAILLVEQLDRLLPTIISRCQIVPFIPLTQHHCYMMCKDDYEPLVAYLLSNMIRNKKAIDEAAESDEFQHAYYIFKKFQEEYVSSPYYAGAFLQQAGFDNKKKRNGKQSMQYFLDMLTTFYRDLLQGGAVVEDRWYQEQLHSFQHRNIAGIELLHIVLNTKDKLLRSVNIALLIDQMIYNMKEVSQ